MNRVPNGWPAAALNGAAGAFLWLACFAAMAADGALRDCADCPEMVVVPAGSSVIGSPRGERDRKAYEGPQHTVRIERSFAAGKFEITRAQFAAFAGTVAAPPRGGGCTIFDASLADFRRDDTARDWRRPGYPQADDHPVVCVTWSEARAYAGWLSKKTGHRYRLLTEAEWEYAARAGTTTSRPWGDDPAQSCRYANLADETLVREVARRKGEPWYPGWHACKDGYAYTAPVGRYQPNRYGLHDMIGNVAEWVEDCWSDSPAGTAAPKLTGDCSRRVYRSSAWRSYPVFGRSAHRAMAETDTRHALIGFRVARDLP